MFKLSLLHFKRAFLIFISGVLVLLFQNCTKPPGVSDGKLDSLSLKASGNGGTYEGKLGSYYHFVPDYHCQDLESKANIIAPQILKTNQDGTYTLESSEGNLSILNGQGVGCKTQSSTITSDVIVSKFQSDFLIFNDDLFSYSAMQPENIPSNLAELLCRDDFSNPQIELIAYYDSRSKKAQFNGYIGNDQFSKLVSAVNAEAPSRLLSSDSVQYVSSQFQINVKLTSSIVGLKRFFGTIKLNDDSTTNLICVRGGELDTSHWPLKTIIKDSTKTSLNSNVKNLINDGTNYTLFYTSNESPSNSLKSKMYLLNNKNGIEQVSSDLFSLCEYCKIVTQIDQSGLFLVSKGHLEKDLNGYHQEVIDALYVLNATSNDYKLLPDSNNFKYEASYRNKIFGQKSNTFAYYDLSDLSQINFVNKELTFLKQNLVNTSDYYLFLNYTNSNKPINLKASRKLILQDWDNSLKQLFLVVLDYEKLTLESFDFNLILKSENPKYEKYKSQFIRKYTGSSFYAEEFKFPLLEGSNRNQILFLADLIDPKDSILFSIDLKAKSTHSLSSNLNFAMFENPVIYKKDISQVMEYSKGNISAEELEHSKYNSNAIFHFPNNKEFNLKNEILSSYALKKYYYDIPESYDPKNKEEYQLFNYFMNILPLIEANTNLVKNGFLYYFSGDKNYQNLVKLNTETGEELKICPLLNSKNLTLEKDLNQNIYVFHSSSGFVKGPMQLEIYKVNEDNSCELVNKFPQLDISRYILRKVVPLQKGFAIDFQSRANDDVYRLASAVKYEKIIYVPYGGETPLFLNPDSSGINIGGDYQFSLLNIFSSGNGNRLYINSNIILPNGNVTTTRLFSFEVK